MTDTERFDWKKHLVACMESTEYCCLATVDSKGVWSNPVYFAWDENFNLYFISQPSSRHMKNIEKDSRIAVSIYSTGQSTFDDVAGIQLEGKAQILAEEAAVEKARVVYAGRKYSDLKQGEEDPYLHSSDWLFVKITPEHLYYFDTRFFDEVRQEVPKEILG
jgi:nitroimidazol reductase NimA-like FMN-containing flavoprotein (pyridoxamine 5'-phosphate oxidase superfamily)